ncbi:uncharacterized protein SCHCODRAFT_02617028 [Schizophyllum commune H4-8]|uniref:uncharacterized protein n=1 Tax=Schizophyllum commune (strain H4-8 / FGSC 9210) TaxID=578458 RepID=UPI00215E02D2|nr:uncharacterized protein SCHCODRAFT_02617028 [Schizophyllum commune H4-8]KAI5897266.1 hypothetical protein SCHCODRAFT_02617028 [Schizophyllum commune H4-8]
MRDTRRPRTLNKHTGSDLELARPIPSPSPMAPVEMDIRPSAAVLYVYNSSWPQASRVASSKPYFVTYVLHAKIPIIVLASISLQHDYT